MVILLDTNILNRLAEPGDKQYLEASAATNLLRTQAHTLAIVPQNLYEFWVVGTRPVSTNGGRGRTAAEMAGELAALRGLFTLLPDNALILPEWERFVTTYAVLGKKAHDARLVAAMSVHGVTHILTFNDADFRRFPSITVLTPAGVLAPPAP